MVYNRYENVLIITAKFKALISIIISQLLGVLDFSLKSLNFLYYSIIVFFCYDLNLKVKG